MKYRLKTQLMSALVQFSTIAFFAFTCFGLITCKEPIDSNVSNIQRILESIAITTPPTKIRYNIGEDLNTQGMIVTATYSDNSTSTVTGYTTSGYNKNKLGNQIITVMYLEKTTIFTIDVIDPSLPTVETPKASPPTGTYTTTQSVTLSTTTEDAKIYYTTNGTIPTISSTLYSSVINIDTTTTLKAFAVKDC